MNSLYPSSFDPSFLTSPAGIRGNETLLEVLQVLAGLGHAIHVGRIQLRGQLMAAGDLDRRVLGAQGGGQVHFLGDCPGGARWPR